MGNANRGYSKNELKDFKGAIEDFNKTIELILKTNGHMQIEDIQK